eukprot:3663660-Pleurochrysis_carterae.AAC.1
MRRDHDGKEADDLRAKLHALQEGEVELMATLERDHFGEGFGLFLHYKMHMTLDKILRITQAASMQFQ